MDNQVLVNRVYSVKVTGVDAGVKTIQDLNNAILATDTAFQAVKVALQQKIDAGGTATEVAKLTTEAKKLSDQLAALVSQQQLSGKEALLLAKSEGEVAKATTETAKTEAIKTKSLIDQAKEADRQLDRADKQAKAAAKTAAANQVEAESYIAIRQQIAQLKPFIEGKGVKTTSTLAFGGNDINYSQAINEFKRLSLAEADFRRQFASDGTLVGEYSSGILKAFHELGVGSDFFKKQKDDINGQLKELVQESKSLAQQMQQAGTIGGEAFGNIDKKLRENISHQESLRTSLKNIESEYGGIGKNITTGISDSFKNLKGQLTQVIVGYVGFQAAVSGVQSIIHQNYELSDSFADLQIRLHDNKEAADEVFESLKKLDTRTSIKDLLDTASIVAKKGVAKEEIIGITEALDRFFVVAGKEAGNREEGTASIVKLISIFNDDKHVTKERVTELASAMVGLQNSGVATSQYLIDFAERVGSVRGLTGITLPNVLGLGAAMQQLGQKSEVAASSSIQILTKILADVPKYAKAAGVGVDVFREKLKNNPFEALVTLGQNLKNNASGFEEVSQDLQEIGVSGSRVKAFFADVATNADYVRVKMKAAGVQIGDSTALLAANDLKQHNFAATLDIIGKQFELIGANTTFQSVLLTVATAVSFLLTNLTPLISAIGVYSAIWAIANASMIAAKIATLATNIALEAQYAWLVISGTVTKAYTVALEAYTAVTEGAAAATTLFELATQALLPGLGFVLVIIGVLAASFKAFGSTVMGTSEALRKSTLQNKIDTEIRDKANEAISDQIVKLNTLVAVVTSTKTSYDTSKNALEELINSNDKFSRAIKDNVINLNEVKRVLAEVTKEIELNARAQASGQLSAEKYKDYLQIVSLREKVEKASIGINGDAQVGLSTTFSGRSKISQSDEDILRSLQSTDFTRSLTGGGTVSFKGSDFNKVKAELETKEKEALGIYQEYQKTSSELQEQITKQNETNVAAKASSQPNVFDRFRELVKNGGKEEDFSLLKKEIDEQKKKFITTSKSYKDLKKLEEELDDYLNPKKKKKDSDKDPFNRIDAKRDTDLANAERSYLESQKSHELSLAEEVAYLNKVKEINLTAYDAKLKILKDDGKLDSEQLLKKAQFQKDRVKLEADTMKQLEALHKKEFDKQSKSLSDNIDNTKRTANGTYENVANNPDSNEGEKLIAKQQFLYTELAAQVSFNARIDELEKQFGQTSKENAQKRADEIIKINTELNKNNYEIQKELFYNQEETSIKIKYNKLRKPLLEDTIMSDKKKDGALAALDKAEKIDLASIELKKATDKYGAAIKELKEAQDELDDIEQNYDPSIGLEASRKRAQEKVNAAKNKVQTTGTNANNAQGSLNDLTKNPGGLQGAIGKALGFDQNTELGKEQYEALASTITASYQFAGQAMNYYFDTERIRIENSLKLAERQIDASKRVALGHAQSAAEAETIERRAEVKKIAVQKTAFEQNKKLQKAQAEINLATQLAGIGAVAFSPNAQNIATGGIWGTIFYAVQAALAVGEYAMNVQKINSASFATGGKVMQVENGRITAPSNIPTRPNGDNILATVRTGEVVLNERQQKALGGDATFASIGVPGFADGGFTGWKPLGNQELGSILKAPINPASFLLDRNSNGTNNSNDSSNRIDLEDMKQSITEMAEHIKNIQVHVVANHVTKQQRKDNIHASIGRLG